MINVAMIGAGSIVFSERFLIDLFSFPEPAHAKVTLIDIDADRLALAHKAAERIKELMKATATIESTLDRQRGLEGADFVVSMFRVGQISVEKREILFAFEKYGLRQTVADTLGLGGVLRAQRTVPVMIDIARDMEQICPDAWLLNHANPMAMNCWGAYAATKTNVVGLCHGVQHTASRLAGLVNIPLNEITWNAAGINHMCWFIDFCHDGEDLYPRLREIAKNAPPESKDLVRFEVLKHFGYYCTESTHHVAEYLPYFLQHDKIVEKFHLGQAIFDSDSLRKRQESRDKMVNKKLQNLESDTPLLQRSVEYTAPIIHSIVTGEERCVYVNVKNTGIITNLPQGCCVEVPCLVNKNGVQPCYVGALPPQCAALNRLNVSVQELAVRAVVERNPEYIYHAAMLDPNTSSVMTLDQIREVVDERLKHDRDLMAALP